MAIPVTNRRMSSFYVQVRRAEEGRRAGKVHEEEEQEDGRKGEEEAKDVTITIEYENK